MQNLLKLIGSSSLIFLNLSFFTATAAQAASSQNELNDYTLIQALLANNTFTGVPDAAKKLTADAQANHHADLSLAADKLSQTKTIEEARTQFEAVSSGAVALQKADKNKNFVVVYCPMKKARWVQKDGPIANPFYGKGEMLECGVKE